MPRPSRRPARRSLPLTLDGLLTATILTTDDHHRLLTPSPLTIIVGATAPDRLTLQRALLARETRHIAIVDDDGPLTTGYRTGLKTLLVAPKPYVENAIEAREREPVSVASFNITARLTLEEAEVAYVREIADSYTALLLTAIRTAGIPAVTTLNSHSDSPRAAATQIAALAGVPPQRVGNTIRLVVIRRDGPSRIIIHETNPHENVVPFARPPATRQPLKGRSR